MILNIKMQCILLLIPDVILWPATTSMKCMFQHLEQRYVRAETFKDEQEGYLNILEVNSPQAENSLIKWQS